MRGSVSLPSRRPARVSAHLWLLLCLLLASVTSARPAAAAPPAPLAGGGAATVPHDAAFLSSTLRLREQLDRFVASRAFARLRRLPAISRAIDSWNEQREMPGSPVSMFLTFLELPENALAVELLADMVSAETFVYGEPSCTGFVKLVRAVQAARQAAALADDLDGDPAMEDLEMEEELDADEEAAAPRRLRVIPARRQIQLDLEPLALPGGQVAAMLEAAAANLDLIAVPDVVWGFRTKKQEAATFQLKRLEVLAKLLGDMNPVLGGAIKRTKLAGGEVLAFKATGRQIPWQELADMLEDEVGGSEDLDKVLARLEALEVVVAIGQFGDWVVLSIGGSLDHLDKLVLPGGKGKSLIDTPPFAKLAEQADKPLTGISYLSQPLVAALGPSWQEDIDPWFTAAGNAAAGADLPPGAADEVRAWLGQVAAELGPRIRKPGPWLSFSFLGRDGYEGHVWDWARNDPLDGSRPLGLLEYAGGRPLAVAVSRYKSDPDFRAAAVKLVREGWSLLARYVPLTRAFDQEERERLDEFSERLVPLGTELVEIIGTKLIGALADGQLAFVLDADSSTRRPQEDLPEAAEPLPLPELAIVVPLADRKQFVEALNDFFAWGDRLVAEIRRIDPDGLPAGYRIPDPVREKVPGGTVWSWEIPAARLDEQIRPAIAVADAAAAFALAPGHAARLLAPARLETGRPLARFAGPLAAAAAIDVPGLIDAIEPWVVYLARYGSVLAAEGTVEPGRPLSADDESPDVAEALAHVRVVLEVARCLKGAVAETGQQDDASVTHWRTVFEDLPAP